MKIALPTEDGSTICAHFGRAPQFLVFTVENEQITGKTLRPNTHAAGEHSHHEPERSHDDILGALADCQVVISQGMGPRAVTALEDAGLLVFFTEETDIETAVRLYLQGDVTSTESGCQQHRCS
ncbi:MAG: NifB/NifX family molybdenum-iron cluster-binding protein [Coprothermobacterota bacterium]|nr:NifB/NifX family molybdenum-iron cluster-binding protein [Coprothermobacterota bacterium]